MRRPLSIRPLVKDTRGANLVEYILLVGVVAIFAIGAFTKFGGKIQEKVGGETKSVGNINADPGPGQ